MTRRRLVPAKPARSGLDGRSDRTLEAGGQRPPADLLRPVAAVSGFWHSDSLDVTVPDDTSLEDG